MNLPQNTIELVRERADIVEVIDRHVPLKKSGKDYKGSCPFHEENTPSFTVSPAKQLYYCFGCGAAGNVFKFLMELGKHSFHDVVLDLAQRYNVPVDDAPLLPLNYPERSRQPSLSTEAPKRFIDYTVDEKRVELSVKRLLHGTSTEAQLARDWLINRGITRKMIAHYQLGLEKRIVTPDDDKPDTKETYWAIAIFIPVPDRPGRYYIKKRVAPWLKSDQRPTYLGKWSQFGVKATFFFTYNPPGATETILCEGEWDAILLGWLALTRGEKIAIACSTAGCGAVPSAEERSRLPGTVTSLYDRDEAGQKGAQRLASSLEGRGRIALVPMPEDCQIKGWDVSNALDAGYTWSDFRAATLVEVAPPSKPYKPEPGEPPRDAYAEYVAWLEEQEWVDEALAAQQVWSGRTFKELVSKVKRRVNRVFRGFGPPPGVSAPPPEVIDYVPGELPTPCAYIIMGCPKIQFSAGQRYMVLQEAIEKDWQNILDSSGTGTFKSNDAGIAQPEAFSVESLWYFSADHRNPTTATVEQNYCDLVVRHNGMFKDDTRKTPLGKSHIRWPSESLGEKANITSNCYRAETFRTLSGKGYYIEGKDNPICAACQFGKIETTPKGQIKPPLCSVTSGKGFGFRHQRSLAFKTNRVRLHPDSAPNPGDIEQVIGAFWDESSRILEPVKTIEATLTDFDRMWALLEGKLPHIHDVLRNLRLALRPLLTREQKQPLHGFGDAIVRDIIGLAPPSILEIIASLQALTPDWQEIFEQASEVDAIGSGLNSFQARSLNKMLSREAYQQSKQILADLAANWLIPFLEVWSRRRPGAIRVNNGVLYVMQKNARHQSITQAMRWNCFLDATETREGLAVKLDIDPGSILHIEQESPRFDNLRFVHIRDMGKLGGERSPSLVERTLRLREGLLRLHPDIRFIDKKAHTLVEHQDGWWFNHNRGSNEYQNISALACFGVPFTDIGVAQMEYITLTGNSDVGKTSTGFNSFVSSRVRAEYIQASGRLRAQLRPNQQLVCYMIGDYDISFLADAYPGCTIEEMRAVDIAWDAGTPHQQNWWKITSAIAQLLEQEQKVSQQTVAALSKVAQSTISWLANSNWKKIIEISISSSNSTFDKILSLLNEQERLEAECIAQDILPVLADASISPDDWAQQLHTTACAYGVMVFRVGLALAPPLVQSKIIAALLGLLPVEVLGEMEAFVT